MNEPVEKRKIASKQAFELNVGFRWVWNKNVSTAQDGLDIFLLIHPFSKKTKVTPV